jgi:Domain of unknown function (DUF397)
VTAEWTKSSFCADKSCIEVARIDRDVIAVRDGKNAGGSDLRFSAGEWHSFLDGVAAGEFDFQ